MRQILVLVLVVVCSHNLENKQKENHHKKEYING